MFVFHIVQVVSHLPAALSKILSNQRLDVLCHRSSAYKNAKELISFLHGIQRYHVFISSSSKSIGINSLHNKIIFMSNICDRREYYDAQVIRICYRCAHIYPYRCLNCINNLINMNLNMGSLLEHPEGSIKSLFFVTVQTSVTSLCKLLLL